MIIWKCKKTQPIGVAEWQMVEKTGPEPECSGQVSAWILGLLSELCNLWMVEKKYCTIDFRLAFLLVWNYQSMLCDRRVEPLVFLTFSLNPFRACFSSCNHHVFLWKCKTCLRWWLHVWLCVCGSNQVQQFDVMSCPYSGAQLIFTQFKVYANAEYTG